MSVQGKAGRVVGLPAAPRSSPASRRTPHELAQPGVSGGMTTRRGAAWRTPVASRIGATTEPPRGAPRVSCRAHMPAAAGRLGKRGRDPCSPSRKLLYSLPWARREAERLPVLLAAAAPSEARRPPANVPRSSTGHINQGGPKFPIAETEEEAVEDRSRAPPPSSAARDEQVPASVRPGPRPQREPCATVRERPSRDQWIREPPTGLRREIPGQRCQWTGEAASVRQPLHSVTPMPKFRERAPHPPSLSSNSHTA